MYVLMLQFYKFTLKNAKGGIWDWKNRIVSWSDLGMDMWKGIFASFWGQAGWLCECWCQICPQNSYTNHF